MQDFRPFDIRVPAIAGVLHAITDFLLLLASGQRLNSYSLTGVGWGGGVGIVDYGIWLLYRPVRLHRLADRYTTTLFHSRLYPPLMEYDFATDVFILWYQNNDMVGFRRYLYLGSEYWKLDRRIQKYRTIRFRSQSIGLTDNGVGD